MSKRAMAIVLSLILLSPLLTALTGCSAEGYPLKKGAKTETVILADKEYTIGAATKTGWQLKVLPSTFDREVKVLMEVLSEKETQQQNKGFELIGTPVKISVSGEDSVRLNSPVTVTMQIPKDKLLPKEKVDDYIAAYYAGNEWVYLFPSVQDISEGRVTFETYHFSQFASVKLTDAEKTRLYAQKMALQTWEEEQTEKALASKVQGMFAEAFEKMGIADSTVQGKLFRSIAKENDFASLLVSAERGDVADYGVKCGEMAANALIKHLKLEKSLMNNITGKGAAIATGLSKGALQVYDGNYTDAAKELTSAFIGYFPAGRAFQAAVEVIDTGIATWKDYELDAAYKSYVGEAKHGAYGYKIQSNDWDTLCIQMRGYLTRIQDEAKNAYCAINGISRGELDKDVALSKKIADSAVSNLKRQFEHRLANERKIKAREAEYATIIEGFKRSLLLERGTFGFEFGADIQDRLRTLFAVRENILSLFGGEMPVLKVGESTEDNLNKAIAKWLSLGPKRRGEFYKWLEDMGYSDKVSLSGGSYAWVLVATKTYDGKVDIDYTNKGHAYRASGSAAPGSYSYTWKYIGKGDTYYDPDLLAGENSTTQCTFTVPPSTIAGGEVVTLSLQLSFGSQMLSYYTDKASASADFEKWDVEPGYSTGRGPTFVNKEGKSVFKIDTYKTVKVYSVSDTVTATAPTGLKEGDRIALRTLFNGPKMGTCYIYEWTSIEGD